MALVKETIHHFSHPLFNMVVAIFWKSKMCRCHLTCRNHVLFARNISKERGFWIFKRKFYSHAFSCLWSLTPFPSIQTVHSVGEAGIA
jgi:hypothetical protein